jgi:nucleotide-binding universal stress UspA family protein
VSRVLVCIDFSDTTEAVAEQGIVLARALGAEVRLLHVGEPDPDFVGYGVGPDTVRDDVAHTLREEHQALERLAERFKAAGVAGLPLMVRGPTVSTILEQAERFGADLLVLGSHGRSALMSLVAGSVAQGVLRAARVPVLIVPSPRA